MATTLTPKEIAQRFESDGRTVRKFLRAEVRANGGAIGVDTPGKGSRWAIEAKSVRAMQKRFNAWVAANAPKAVESVEVTESD